MLLRSQSYSYSTIKSEDSFIFPSPLAALPREIADHFWIWCVSISWPNRKGSKNDI